MFGNPFGMKRDENKAVHAKKGMPVGFIIYVVLISAWLLPIAAAPLLLMQGNEMAYPIYAAYGSAFVCHQLNSRSLCYFPNENSIADCTRDSTRLEYVKSDAVELNGNIGFKIPVCARDVGIYAAMLIGGFAVLLLGRAHHLDWPSPWFLVAAVIPMAIDGTTQLFGMRESSNSLRLWTGFLTGIALPFYFVPFLNYLAMWGKK